MATFNRFEVFATDIADGDHAACLNTSSDVLAIYATNATPSASGDSVKADLAEITMTNLTWTPVATGGGQADVQNNATTTAGQIAVAGTDCILTASGGAGAAFQYIALFNDTHASDALIGWWDYGSAVTLQDGESFTVDFGTNIFTVG